MIRLHSLPRIMSKYLDFGMSLGEVLDAVTRVPARLVHRESLASMAPGTEADLVIFKVKEKEVPYCDRTGHTFTGHPADHEGWRDHVLSGGFYVAISSTQ